MFHYDAIKMSISACDEYLCKIQASLKNVDLCQIMQDGCKLEEEALKILAWKMSIEALSALHKTKNHVPSNINSMVNGIMYGSCDVWH